MATLLQTQERVATVRRTPTARKLTELILDVFRFWGELERHGHRLVKPFGQTPSRWQVMGAASEAPRTVAQIARRMGLTRQAVQRVAHALVRDRLAEFALNPEHRRSPILRLTSKGEALLARINAAQAVCSNTLAEGLRLTDLDAAVQTLRTVTRRLKESP